MNSTEAKCQHDWRGIDTGRMCAKCGKVERADDDPRMEAANEFFERQEYRQNMQALWGTR